MLRLDNLT